MANNLMYLLRNLFRILWEAWRDALPAFRVLGRDLLEHLQRWCRREQLSERERRRAHSRCVPIYEPAYKRPDPMIYSQTYLMKLGLAVTWDNPDIQLYQSVVPVPSSRLDPDTEYDIVARIWNNSTEAPVVDLPVRFSYLSFGIGTQSHTIGDAHVTLGVKGGANHPAFARVKWRTPTAVGHYCIQVLLDWLDDANPLNNLGQENTNVGEIHSPVQFTFMLHNPTHEVLGYHFEIDVYQIPKRQPCSEVERNEPREGMDTLGRRVPEVHDRRNYPLPRGWIVDFDPSEPELAPGAAQLVRMTVTVPDDFLGRQPINVNTFHHYGLAGGLTFYVERK